MQRLSVTTDSEPRPDVCARELLEALPPVMRFVRFHMRSHRSKGLSVPQFRTLVMLQSVPAASLSALAEQLGASNPTTSRIVSCLVKKQLVQRRRSTGDRRQIELELTSRGAAVMETARRATRDQIAGELASLSHADLVAVLRAMRSLHTVFAGSLRLLCKRDRQSRKHRSE